MTCIVGGRKCSGLGYPTGSSNTVFQFQMLIKAASIRDKSFLEELCYQYLIGSKVTAAVYDMLSSSVG